ncbi:MAG: nucleotidyltransferase domain-containing protein, partial [Anaerolineales bacterium]
MDDRLSKFSEERQLLLDRIVSFLEKDPRIVAAWLFGSLGRAEYDDLSDIDIWIVIADEFIQEISQLRRQFVSQIGVPLLVVEA